MNRDHLVVKILTPFSPSILKAEVSAEIVKSLNEQCDKIIENEEERKKKNCSNKLVGHTSEALDWDLNGYDEFGHSIYYLTKCLYSEWIATHDKKNLEKIQNITRIAIHDAWYVRQFKNEFNPAHHHKNASNFSCILFLKVPDSISPKKTNEGYTDFLYGAMNNLTASNYTVCPKVGDMYIFPSFLTHTVYPFYGKGERRSFSANMSLE